MMGIKPNSQLGKMFLKKVTVIMHFGELKKNWLKVKRSKLIKLMAQAIGR